MSLVSTGSESTGSGSFNHIAGPVVGMNVMANPTLKELNDYGVTWFKTEPNYTSGDGDDKQYMLDIWFNVEGFTYKDKSIEDGKEKRSTRFYLKPITRVSKDGNKQYVNKFGKFAWENSSNWSSFNQDGMREAVDGEEAICKWLAAFGNFKQTDEMQLTREKLLKGDFSEVIHFINNSPERKFKLLLGIGRNEEKARFTSVVYNREFWRAWQNEVWIDGKNVSFEEFIGKIEFDQYKEFKKAVVVVGKPMILINSEVEKMADLPNESAAINEEAGMTEEDPLF
jgi:hypothetical protein